MMFWVETLPHMAIHPLLNEVNLPMLHSHCQHHPLSFIFPKTFILYVFFHPCLSISPNSHCHSFLPINILLSLHVLPARICYCPFNGRDSQLTFFTVVTRGAEPCHKFGNGKVQSLYFLKLVNI